MADRPQFGDTPAGKMMKETESKLDSQKKESSPIDAVGRLVKDLATGGAYSKTYSARPDGRSDNGSGHDER